MVDIREQKLIFHLTDINNLETIFSDGLKPRSLLEGFSDVADPDIIDSRRALQLEKLVPFHFFAGNPFDGRVHLDNRGKKFVLITVHRDHAKANNWKIIPRHPLSGMAITLLDYEAGMNATDWATMNLRKYDNDECKRICMAECLSPETVSAKDFFSIYVPDAESENTVNTLKQKHGLNMYVNNSPKMFPGV
ncbi:DarT ssDNA thymidine ADP-ribosyltransferase family protein [Serratia nevei]|uniref:DarT ssDNA thymidine ADP-ribosyltransferase family protein n=1 Tax=Serratia nevei TaxID=2703794 RepID=UPI0038CAA915